jgi:hypothetical protein
VLGVVGKSSFADLIGQDGGRFWYEQRRLVTADGIPLVLEVAIGEDQECDGPLVHYGINFSPTLDGPLADVHLRLPAESGIWGTAEGLYAVLDALHVVDDDASVGTQTAFHLVSPALGVLDVASHAWP